MTIDDIENLFKKHGREEMFKKIRIDILFNLNQIERFDKKIIEKAIKNKSSFTILDLEGIELIEELNEIAKNSKFNGIHLLNF